MDSYLSMNPNSTSWLRHCNTMACRRQITIIRSQSSINYTAWYGISSHVPDCSLTTHQNAILKTFVEDRTGYSVGGHAKRQEHFHHSRHILHCFDYLRQCKAQLSPPSLLLLTLSSSYSMLRRHRSRRSRRVFDRRRKR